MADELRFQLAVDIADIDRHHPAAELALRELLNDLNDTPDVHVESKGEEATGIKGVVDTLLMTTTPLAIPAVVRLFRLWLARDKARSINVTITSPGKQPTTVEVTGDNVSLQVLQQAVSESFKALNKGAQK